MLRAFALARGKPDSSPRHLITYCVTVGKLQSSSTLVKIGIIIIIALTSGDRLEAVMQDAH